jgi:hypothetical protein
VAAYALEVNFPDKLLAKVEQSKRESLVRLLENDPRPSYIDDGDRIYTFSFSKYEISFKVLDGILTVTDVVNG